LPEFIWGLPKLQSLLLRDNASEGRIPTAARGSNLKILNLAFNFSTVLFQALWGC
jgi:hypothetical protein